MSNAARMVRKRNQESPRTFSFVDFSNIRAGECFKAKQKIPGRQSRQHQISEGQFACRQIEKRGSMNYEIARHCTCLLLCEEVESDCMGELKLVW